MDLRYMRNVFGIFNLLLCLIYVPAAVAAHTYQGASQYATVYQTFSISDQDAIPGQWMKLGQVSLATWGGGALLNTNPCRSNLSLMCTGGAVDLGYNGQASYILYLTRTPVTVTDDAGNSYQMTVAFPSGDPVIGVTEQNSIGGNMWNTTAALTSGTGVGRFDTPQESQDALSTSTTQAQGYCGAIPGCQYHVAVYPHTTSGMPYIYLKLPANLSARTISFSEQQVLRLRLAISKRTPGYALETPVVSLYLSGTITVPQRCYISADNSSFNFGTVYSNSSNGLQGQQAITLTTDCYYAPENKQYLKMEAVSGGTLTDGGYIYQIAADSSSQKALGIVFNINNNANCDGTTTDKNMFSQEYLIRDITYQQHYSTTDKVNFALCKYGVPATTDIGQKQIVVKLTSRWVAS